MLRALALVAILFGSACAPRVSVPEGERQRASKELEGQRRYAKVALFLGPFFADDSRLFASDQPFSELDLLETPSGEVIAPPPAERVLSPGTPLRIQRVEFPTGWIIAERYVRTPRYHPWVYLALEGERRPVMLVLPQTLANAEEVRAELERVVGAADRTPALRALPEHQRAAIARKELVEGMAPLAVEMAWGYPERKLIDRPSGNEDWTWPTGKRKARFRDGKLAGWEPR